MSREEEVNQVLQSVVDIRPCITFDKNGHENSHCPFCHEGEWGELEIEEIAHDPNCTWLIARDLLTNK